MQLVVEWLDWAEVWIKVDFRPRVQTIDVDRDGYLLAEKSSEFVGSSVSAHDLLSEILISKADFLIFAGQS